MLKHVLILAAAVGFASAAHAGGMGDISANGHVFSTHTQAPAKPVKPYCDTTATRPASSSDDQSSLAHINATCLRKLPEVPPGAVVIPT